MAQHQENTIETRGKKKSARNATGTTHLGAYLQEIARVSVLDAEQEKDLSAKIALLRISYWKAILSYPPFIEAIAEFIEARPTPFSGEDKDPPAKALDDAVRHSRAYRDRETRAHRDAYEASREKLAEAMASADLDDDLSDEIAADLEAIDANRKEGLSLDLVCPPRGSRPFASYVHRVRACSTALRSTKNRFVRANLRLVVSIARRFDHGLMPLQDLIQEGNLGLMKAVDRFDGARGFRFSTYATWWIRHAVNRALANKGRTVRLPAHVSADLQRIGRARRELETRAGLRPTTIELAEKTGLNPVRIRKLLDLTLETTMSLDTPMSDDDRRSLVERIHDPNAAEPTETLELNAMSAILHDSLESLDAIEVDILRRRFGIEGSVDFEPMTLRELGERHSLSRERIRQLQERAISKLRREFQRREAA